MIFHIMKHANGKQVLVYLAWWTFIGLVLIFLRHCLYLLPSLWKSHSLIVTFLHSPLGLRTLIYYSNNYNLHSLLYGFFFSFSFPPFLITESIAMSTVNANCGVLISFVIHCNSATFKRSSIPLSFLWEVFRVYWDSGRSSRKINHAQNLGLCFGKEFYTERISVAKKWESADSCPWNRANQ